MATTGEPASKGERSRQALLDAAIVRFARDGYRATSVTDIARDARLSGTASYAYFPNKEALFVAAVDEDAAGVIAEGLERVLADTGDTWREELLYTLLDALERHPLAKRILGGLEPEFTMRLLGIPALEQLRKASSERMRAQQLAGEVRADIDVDKVAGGMLVITLSLLMSLIQTGSPPDVLLGAEVSSVFEAALRPPDTPSTR